MRVSVIIPALNEEKNIETTLRSIKAQDYEGEIELIVADGNSTDKTVEISKSYGAKVVIEHTRTIAAGRQAGAKISHGDLLLYTDADVWAEKAWVRQMVRAFDDPKVVAAYGVINPRNTSGLERLLLGGAARATAHLLNLVGTDYVSGNNLAVRKTSFDKIGGFNITLITGEDTDIIQRARKIGKVVFVPEAKIDYSMRRVREWGYPKYLWFHTKNFFMSMIFHAPAKTYETVRKTAD